MTFQGKEFEITHSATPGKASRRRNRSAAAAPVLIAALLLTGCVANGAPVQPAPVAPSVMVQPAPASNAPLETTQASTKVPVYWIGRSGTDVFLYREFRDIAGEENPVTTALRTMMAQKPLDRDFFTPWQAPGNLATSISGKNVITVDVSEDAFNSNLDAGMADKAVQQLVYTATAAAAASGLVNSGQQIQVVILVDGHKDFMAFGQIKLGGPMTRDASLVAPVWIIDPQEDATLAPGQVKINGRSVDATKILRWQLLQENPDGGKSNFLNGQATASTEAGQGGAFSIPVELPAGRYELRVSQLESPDIGTELYTDTKHFSIR